MPQNKQKAKAYDKAVDLLSIRMHTSFELAKKLKQKGYEAQEIKEAIERLTEERYLKDEDTARFFLENLMNYKTFGYFGLKAKMMQKGIPNAMIETLLQEFLTLDEETKIAQRAVSKSHTDDPRKLAMMLQRKGFRGQVISRVTQTSTLDE